MEIEAEKRIRRLEEKELLVGKMKRMRKRGKKRTWRLKKGRKKSK